MVAAALPRVVKQVVRLVMGPRAEISSAPFYALSTVSVGTARRSQAEVNRQISPSQGTSSTDKVAWLPRVNRVI